MLKRYKHFLVMVMLALIGLGSPVSTQIIDDSMIYLTPSESDLNTKILKLKSLLDIDEDAYLQISFVDTEIDDVLRFFSDELNLNIITNPDVTGQVSFAFDNIHPLEAFNAVIQSQGLNWHHERDVIYVYLDHPMVVIPLEYSKAADVLDSVRDIVSLSGDISMDERSNSIIVKAPQVYLEKIERAIRRLDQKPLQVLVEVKILEVQNDGDNVLGIGPNHNGDTLTATSFGLATAAADAANPGMFVRVLEGNIDVLMEATKTNTDINVLATPRVLALNHEEASIITGQRLGYKVNTTSTTGTLVEESIDFLEVGTKLTFTPHISSQGDITMEIKPEVSEGRIDDAGLPQETTTEASTVVRVKDGETIMIGGLIREKDSTVVSGIPILSDIPLLNLLFQKTSVTKEKKETIVLITPYLTDAISPKHIPNLSGFEDELDDLIQYAEPSGHMIDTSEEILPTDNDILYISE